MNGKKGSIEINIPSIAKTRLPGNKKCGEASASGKGWILSIWEVCKEDTNRVIFSLKVGLAVLFVSLFILCRAPSQVFGTNIIWSILNVAMMFEFTVGTVMSSVKLWPSLVPYEYGFRVILFTYCLIIVSGYRMGNPIRTAMDRLYSIAIGAIVTVLVNVLIFPI
ncbi:aluminum-activated malate transporter 9-like [Olea europaea subsp. europaea]|uniref:Aluminum-activated malate transporter 9-like n=1 Tax=Olea europaea subsp. europaea TaxID=158383 RepID=A0A8S0Q5C2_OLEEU|nr:aluminum-activated malate transporter 9-like [Olea europaea subsp. europaea]